MPLSIAVTAQQLYGERLAGLPAAAAHKYPGMSGLRTSSTIPEDE